VLAARLGIVGNAGELGGNVVDADLVVARTEGIHHQNPASIRSGMDQQVRTNVWSGDRDGKGPGYRCKYPIAKSCGEVNTRAAAVNLSGGALASHLS
jgi:hypothetical protein